MSYKSFIFKKEVKSTLNYMVYLPKSYDKKKWPLIYSLHGIGECGDNIEIIKRWGIHKLFLF